MRRTTFLILALLPTLAFSQGKVWTLEECIQYAVEHNPQRTKQEAQNKIYQQDQREALGGFLPSVTASSNVYMNFGRNIDPETNTYISTNTFYNSYEIYSSMTLFDGLSQIYRAKAAKINRLMGEDQLRDIKDNLALETMELYFNVLYYKGTVDIAKQQLEESEADLKRTQRMEELGLKSIPDLTEIKAKEAEDRLALTKQMNLLELEVIKLKTKMNFPVTDEFSVADYKMTASTDKTTENAYDIYQQAIGTLPRLRTSEKTVKAAEMQYKIARGSLFPTLSLIADVSTVFSRLMDSTPYESFGAQLKNHRGTAVGFSISVPIFSGFSRSAEMKRSKQRLIMAQSDNEDLFRQVYSDIEQAVADVNGLSDEYRFAQKRTEAMFSAHQVNLRKYEEGLIDAIEVSTSANRLLNARVEELYTNLKYQLKYKLLQYYKGESSWILF
ncbi:MAG: TolC family protein [Candidatus Azobacteroides sp.]|nr:TolC family protein [Candidatus Azobacteroides sp.]